ncbi:NAD-dependent epimerase/dehydratase family protein [Falsiroseomonas oryzae]|uniref:NAD-dependent epimerase/dehydratase family protein n=1 Tax=Falsiroseomonas oryzae TaxID=2766473 RepID=UPI0022EAC540|nr:NAD(P)-dependent oxidoreductase [Roseomonas sp. MO-31]
MRILITGHLGYIGTAAVPIFLEAGHEVVGCDTDLFRGSTFGRHPGPAAKVPNLGLDIRDLQPDHLAGFDAVVHLAGLSNHPLGNRDPAVTDAINHRAAVRVAAAAKRAGVPRFAFSSSCANYGASGEELIDETAPFAPLLPYGQSKVDAERGIAALADDGFSPVILRNATAFGLSPRLRFDLVVNNLTAWACATGEVLLKSDGTPWRPLVHVDDISRAFLAVCEAPREDIHLQAFNIGATEANHRVIEIAQAVADVVPGTVLRFAPGAGPDRLNYRVSGDKFARRFPHAAPRRTVRESVEELLEACLRQRPTPEEFEGARYQRLAHLNALIAAGRVTPDYRPVVLTRDRVEA